jgi:hypothetical protein
VRAAFDDVEMAVDVGRYSIDSL